MKSLEFGTKLVVPLLIPQISPSHLHWSLYGNSDACESVFGSSSFIHSQVYIIISSSTIINFNILDSEIKLI